MAAAASASPCAAEPLRAVAASVIESAPQNQADEKADDWRILRTLTYYRLLLAALITLGARGHIPYFFDRVDPSLFPLMALGYTAGALMLLPVVLLRRPGLGAQTQLHFIADALGICCLVYAANGVSSGLGVLLLTPAVGCSSLLGVRLAMLQAAIGTLFIFGEELLRQSHAGFSPAEMSGAGLLGLMLFGTTAAASAVAQRARRSEALAARVGSDLASLSQLNESIVAGMQTGVVVLDHQRNIRLLNGAARQLLGAAPDSEGTTLDERYPELRRALEGWELNPGRDPEPLTLWASGVEVLPRFTRLGPADTASQVLVLLEDAAHMREQAQQMKLAALGRLSASIAHEIRNPLSAIHHAGQLLAESPRQDQEDSRLLNVILRHSGRIDKIVEDVLNLSRREAAMPSTFALRPFLERTLALYREDARRQSGHIEFGEVEDDLKVRFDPNQLQRILHNLWDNSFAHGVRPAAVGPAEAVKVQLSAGRRDPREPAWLDIADNGRGIPAGLRDKVFEPFFTTAHSGTGLGLYLSRELCEYNQARLLLMPSEQGVRFRIYFAS